jgi:hypothetical protein
LIKARNSGLEITCELVSRPSIGFLTAVSPGQEYGSKTACTLGLPQGFPRCVACVSSHVRALVTTRNHRVDAGHFCSLRVLCFVWVAGEVFASGQVTSPALLDIVTAESYYSPHVRPLCIARHAQAPLLEAIVRRTALVMPAGYCDLRRTESSSPCLPCLRMCVCRYPPCLSICWGPPARIWQRHRVTNRVGGVIRIRPTRPVSAICRQDECRVHAHARAP